ncbi:carbonic anhydrase [Haematobacter massiliensis]|uniref:Carbonic anhydrase n=1 Tax=Haematobacter massiliensis TaxID=195105 RepID=A0A086XZG6_9RHOB|nr:carbonic anhydrase [Haematobacter massiliensis]KFI27416.1 carbonic anhydrase [Haematobacter massiliensis]OWJ70834.1 carbonic anhydrase [Haematobacter massiliensis]OWJ84844.1 carbonic anhydrase [Haematobacter massiliensis]QBJ23864.1 carbonic anhydrase [Haematobacter massiliensis]
MLPIRPLPGYLVQRYHGWRATIWEDNRNWYRRLAEDGQRPRAMVIACCDSRVDVASIFGADSGELFIHRNVANLVPPYAPDGDHHGTSAAVEYAVETLRVANLIVMGHSRCGGVQGCYDMCAGHAPQLEEKTSFVGRWMDILRPAYAKVLDVPEAERVPALEKLAVLTGIDNLLSFPFVTAAVEEGRLSLHGVWNDIGEGGLESYDSTTESWNAV